MRAKLTHGLSQGVEPQRLGGGRLRLAGHHPDKTSWAVLVNSSAKDNWLGELGSLVGAAVDTAIPPTFVPSWDYFPLYGY